MREFDVLDQLVAGLSAEEFDLPLLFGPKAPDRWTVKDALAHITFWKAEVGRVARRQPRPPWLRAAMAGDHHNHVVYKMWRDRSPGDVISFHRDVHAGVLAAFKAAPETWFSERKATSWWPPNIDCHVAHHRRDIEKALAVAHRQ